jgi:hypothetical protein
MNKQLPIYKLVISSDDDVSGVSAIALVEQPAIEIDFFAFKAESKAQFQFKAISTDKQLLAGYLMIPDKLIFRVQDGNEYYVTFDNNTIAMIAEKFNKNKLQSNFNTEHSAANALQNVFVKENWIIESAEFDKSKMYGFEPIVGAWFGIIKVDDANIWNEYVKTGEVKGFSVEGNFEMVYDKMFVDQFKAIHKPIKVGFDFDNTLSLIRGQELSKEELAKGNEVYIITSKDKHKSKNVYRVAAKLGIPTSNVRFTYKDRIVDAVKGLGLSKWYDNDQTQLDFIKANSGVQAIKFESMNPFTNFYYQKS